MDTIIVMPMGIKTVDKNVLVGLPADVVEDLDAVCPPRGVSKFIVAAIRKALDGEPAAQRKRAERAEAIKAKPGTGQELTPAEAAQWWREVEQRHPIATVYRSIVDVGGEAVAVDPEDAKRLRDEK